MKFVISHVIFARGNALDFDLPAGKDAGAAAVPVRSLEDAKERPEFLTETEVEKYQRENPLKVLEISGWKVKGADGAAELVGVKPTTLLSRIKKMGSRRK